MRCPCPCGLGRDFFLEEKNTYWIKYVGGGMYVWNEVVLEFILDLNRKRLRFFDLYANLKIMEKVNQWQ